MNDFKLIPVDPQPMDNGSRWIWPLPDHARSPGCCTEVCTASREWWEYAPSEAKPHPMAEAVMLRDERWYWCVPDSPVPKEPASEGAALPAELAEILRVVREEIDSARKYRADGRCAPKRDHVTALCDAVETYWHEYNNAYAGLATEQRKVERLDRECAYRLSLLNVARSEAQAAKRNLQHAETRIQRLESERDAVPVPRCATSADKLADDIVQAICQMPSTFSPNTEPDSVRCPVDDLHACVKQVLKEVLAPPKPGPREWSSNEREVNFYEREFYVLSNFSAFNLTLGENTFRTSEHAYHWLKFPGHPEIRCDIRNAPSAHEAFKIAERNKHLVRPDWSDGRVDVMRNLLRAKAQQHEYVRRKLLETGDRELIEGSWRDTFWGCGENRDGENMLGKLWMEIRAELRQERDTALTPHPASPSTKGDGNG